MIAIAFAQRGMLRSFHPDCVLSSRTEPVFSLGPWAPDALGSPTIVSGRTIFIVAIAALFHSACGPTALPQLGDDNGADPGPGNDGSPSTSPDAVFAHSATNLYRIDPDSLLVTPVGQFAFTGQAKNVTDIAIDRSGRMLGVSLDNVYSIDPDTAIATLLAPLNAGYSSFTSLSFVPVTADDLQGPERLIAARFDGEVFEIDPQTGASTRIGDYGDDNGRQIGSSGDIVSVHGFGTVATVNVEGRHTDHLAWIDGTTFEATLIGDTEYDSIYGLGFWGGMVYGFTEAGQFLSIDVTTGAATPIEADIVMWWGSGVTTIAPIVL
jgi:hypothetical protein